ncbi:hypothetical protein Rs2_38163 [Raphanus sativus]|uniref:Uncharacterized protein LOC108820611 isoform X2 n=1 Tax=Raphanus sativus TaxID=3726 RepID=A0A9W3CB10_RAPSA|nr:uncharacterized protein LOC108820611 isoform X2 [Raphanus sativus]KAJ4881108.1 hypothetical protein Rs2_38163 [Raphanus sativus]
MEEVHSAAEPHGCSDSPFTISQPPDIKNWFSSYVYESLALTSVREEDKCILGADKDHKPINKNMSDTNLYESSSLPSEPPDIANWFSSYAYESPPVLDTNDALYFSVGGEDSECVKETQAEEEEEIGGKYVCPSLFDQQQLVSSAKVTDFSQSQHLLSEPPDVGNWFSSYEYQSPHLSDTHELEFCSPELIVEESDTEGDNSSGIFRKTKSKQDTIIAPDCLKSNDCNESMATDTEVSAYSNQERKNKSTVSLFSASTREVGQEALFCEMKDEPSFSHSGVSSCYNPKPQSLAYLQEELRPKENDHETISTSSSMQKTAEKEENLESVGSDGKENLEGKSTETGFVTMKKARFRDQSSMTRPIRGVLGECSRSKELTKMATEEEEERKKKRRVLGEMSNHQLVGGEEIAGKWSCPQKKKGRSGPPLKQLRLDAWMRKV